MPRAIEELEDLDCTLAAEANGVTILRRLNRAVLAREGGRHGREFVDALAIVEQVMHHLVHASLRDLLAQHLAHAVFGLVNRACQIADPWRVEASGCYQRLELSRQRFLTFRKGYRVPGQVQPRTA